MQEGGAGQEGNTGEIPSDQDRQIDEIDTMGGDSQQQGPPIILRR